MKCKVCSSNSELVFEQSGGVAITSLGKIIEAKADTFLCSYCSHCQTHPSINLFEYYSNEYKTLSFSMDEDDLYGYESGIPIYRNSHQAKTLSKKLKNIKEFNLSDGPLLDFGCGKSLVMKYFIKETPVENVYLYDVSNDYIKFWKSFLPSEQYACFDLPPKWDGYFNLITSFFSLEHVADPISELKKINQLLKKDGLVYIVVPNMYSENIADMIVVDHIHHYSEPSMELLLNNTGFEMIEADHLSHAQGSIYIGKSLESVSSDLGNQDEVEEYNNKCKEISKFWNKLSLSINLFENEMTQSGVKSFYILGAGILGTYVYSQIKNKKLITGFIDSNEHKQEKGWQGVQVFGPNKGINAMNIAVFCGFNEVQIGTIMEGMLPKGIDISHVWNIKSIKAVN